MDLKKGQLIMAANILGPLDQLSTRTTEALVRADMVIFEEDRPARQALKRAGIHREYFKFNEHNQSSTLELLRSTLTSGKTAVYMSDQGMPTIADPGSELLSIAYSLGSKITILPGASSVTAALSACPFLQNSFFFYGFLPREKDRRSKELEKLFLRSCPVVILDTPYRFRALVDTFLSLASHQNRSLLIAMDISGDQEDFKIVKINQLPKLIEKIHKKLNFVLILKPKSGLSATKR